MKKTKKTFLAVFFAILAFAFITPCFAAGTGSITIDNYDSTATYKAYKILDVTYDSTNTHYSYTIDYTSQWWSVINGYAGLTKTRIGTSNKYIVEKNSNFDVTELAELLNGSVSGKTVTGTFSSATLNGLDLGYYFVTTTNGTLCSITTTDAAARIVDKNITPEITKTINDPDKVVYVGQVVTYTINGVLPQAAAGYSTKYTYKIEDTMSTGLTFDPSSVVVKVDGTTYAPKTGELTTTATGFTLNLDLIANTTLNAKLGKNIVVTYNAKVNESAIERTSEPNKAKLTYSDDPSDSSSTETTPDEVVTVKTANIKINKIIKDTTTKLAGAKFTLVNSAGKYYTYDDTNDAVVWSNTLTEYTSDGINTIDFNGLDAGTYTLTETSAPDGYNKLSDPLTIVVGLNSSGNFEINTGTSTGFSISNNKNYVSDVENATGIELPSTGGKGTTLLITFGSLLFVATSIILVTKKRLYNEAN